MNLCDHELAKQEHARKQNLVARFLSDLHPDAGLLDDADYPDGPPYKPTNHRMTVII